METKKVTKTTSFSNSGKTKYTKISCCLMYEDTINNINLFVEKQIENLNTEEVGIFGKNLSKIKEDLNPNDFPNEIWEELSLKMDEKKKNASDQKEWSMNFETKVNNFIGENLVVPSDYGKMYELDLNDGEVVFTIIIKDQKKYSYEEIREIIINNTDTDTEDIPESLDELGMYDKYTADCTVEFDYPHLRFAIYNFIEKGDTVYIDKI